MGTARVGWALALCWAVFLALAWTVVAHAAPGSEPVTDAPTLSEWFALYHSLGEMKGMGALGVVAVLIQAVVLFLRSSFDPLPPPLKLLAITGATMILGTISMKMATNVGWGVALLHSTNLAALQVFAFNLYQQLVQPRLIALSSAPTGHAAPPSGPPGDGGKK